MGDGRKQKKDVTLTPPETTSSIDRIWRRTREMREQRGQRVAKLDKKIAALFFALTVLFLVVAMTNQAFFEWAFSRHHNQWSWYIRPLFLVPFCYFSYRQSWAGVSITIFSIFTSMFWFSRPEIVSDNVMTFLQFEKDWLYSAWGFEKVMLIITVPISFAALGLAFWRRSLFVGLGVVALMATGKMVWSIQSAGEAGKSIVVPAVLGLAICAGLISYGFYRLEKRK